MSMAPFPLLTTCDSNVRAYALDGAAVPVPSSPVYNGAQPTIARWYPNGRLLAVALSSGVIAFHHHDKLNIIGHFNASVPAKRSGPSSTVTCVDITSGSRFLAAGTDSGAVIVWDMKSSNAVNTFNVDGPVSAVAFQHTADSRYVACATGADVMLFSRASNRLVDSFTVAAADSSNSPLRTAIARARVTALAFSPHAVNLLAVTDDTGCVNVWDISRTHASRGASSSSKIGTDATYSRFTSPLRVSATDLAFTCSSSSAGLLVASLDKHIRLYDKLLRRFLFAIASPAPVTAVAYCWDDVHVAAGHSSGETTILSIDVAGKTSRITRTLPAASANDDTHAPHSTAVRTLDFQPRVSSSGSSNVDASKFAHGVHVRNAEHSDGRPAARMAQRANTSPSLVSGMLLNLPERAADDALPRYNPRDSELFSPILQSSSAPKRRNFSSRTPTSAPITRDLTGEYGTLESFDVSRSSSGVPSVDRRLSDIIPTSTPASSRPFTGFDKGFEKAIDGDPFLDGDAVDSLLFSPPGAENTGALSESSLRTPLPAIDEERQVSDIGSTTKTTNLPRGMAFRRIRKSASEMTPKNMRLPPRPPRSITLPSAVQIPGAVEVEEEVPVKDGADESVAPNEIDDYVARQMQEAQKAAHESPSKETIVADGAATDGVPTDGNADPTVAELVRRTIVGEMDAVRQDLRSDILNIHTELVLSSSRQTRTIEAMFTARDKLLQELLREVSELRKENALLKERYIGR